jgi:GxxExxY protein
MRDQLLQEPLTRSVIGAFYEVYNTLGYGYLEHVYVTALERERRARGHRVAREVGLMVRYKGSELVQQRIDMLVDGALIVEAKSSELLHPAAKRQLTNYLKGTGIEVGLLLHFGPDPKVYRAIFTQPLRCDGIPSVVSVASAASSHSFVGGAGPSGRGEVKLPCAE